jgi:TatD DNase family protein
MYVDVHSHLFVDVFDDDRDDVIKSAIDHKVGRIVNNGLDYQTNKACLRLAECYDTCVAAAGLYPDKASEIDGDERQRIVEQFHDDRVRAIGEVGLDYGYADGEEDRRRQRELFRTCVRVGKEERKPLIIHSRNAEKDVIDILEELDAYCPVLHAFTGRRHMWQRAVRNGYYFSIPPVVVRANQFKQLVEDVPSHQILTESDAPYLGRQKGERSTPADVAKTADVIESIRGLEDTASMLGENYERVFA